MLEQLKQTGKTMLKTAKQMVMKTGKTIKKELNKTACVLQVLMPIILLYIYINYNLTIIHLLCISIVVNICISYVKQLGYNLNSTLESGLPIPAVRFTKLDSNGFIELTNTENNMEMIQYINDLETYLESKGVL